MDVCNRPQSTVQSNNDLIANIELRFFSFQYEGTPFNAITLSIITLYASSTCLSWADYFEGSVNVFVQSIEHIFPKLHQKQTCFPNMIHLIPSNC
jgi:hypothetical protein